jgi:hypothetical protein
MLKYAVVKFTLLMCSTTLAVTFAYAFVVVYYDW